jgi:LysM repeat protein
MNIAQTQADYEQSIGSQTDSDANGLRPYQRALAAGYLLAGNITTNVGDLSELLFGGVNVSAKDAVQMWYGDADHKPYLLSLVYQDIGAGVAQSNNTFYYVIVIALSTGGTPIAYTPPPPLYTSVPTFIPNTPNSDGSIVHIVQKGDTALGIAIEYGISLTDLYKLNGLTDRSVIYQGTKIIIRAAFTPTPTEPTATPTERPTITMWPTASFTATVSPIPPTPTPSPGLAESTARNAVITIAAAALVIAGVIALLARKRR